jgi:hypothetical protein
LRAHWLAQLPAPLAVGIFIFPGPIGEKLPPAKKEGFGDVFAKILGKPRAALPGVEVLGEMH